MAGITSTLQTTITAVDPNNQQPVNRTNTVKLVGTAGEFNSYITLPNTPGALAVQLPISPATVVSVKNLAAAGTIAVTVTPNGGVAAIVANLGPGAMYNYADSSAAGAGIGITALTLTPSTNGMQAELYIGG